MSTASVFDPSHLEGAVFAGVLAGLVLIVIGGVGKRLAKAIDQHASGLIRRIAESVAAHMTPEQLDVIDPIADVEDLLAGGHRYSASRSVLGMSTRFVLGPRLKVMSANARTKTGSAMKRANVKNVRTKMGNAIKRANNSLGQKESIPEENIYLIIDKRNRLIKQLEQLEQLEHPDANFPYVLPGLHVRRKNAADESVLVTFRRSLEREVKA